MSMQPRLLLIGMLPAILLAGAQAVVAGESATVTTESTQIVMDNGVMDNVRGLVKAGEEATIASEIAAQITKMPYQEGEAFEKGATLVQFDCSLLYAEVKSAQAERAARDKKHENNQKLAELSAIGKLEVEISAAEAAKAAADLTAARLRASKCKIEAPYSGRVVEQLAQEYESVSPEQELIHIVNTGDLTIELLVSSYWLTWLKPGTEFEFAVDETGQTYTATVDRLGAMVDPVSHTVTVYGHFIGDAATVLPGMSGSARFNRAADHGH